MTIPPFTKEGFLPPGIHSASLNEILGRFSHASDRRQGLGVLLTEVVNAAGRYATIKRILVWGSFVTDKLEPNDLDYSLVVGIGHQRIQIASEHERFLVPVYGKIHYATDPGFLVIRDHNLSIYIDRLDFIRYKSKQEVGIVEISLRGERSWEDDFGN